MGGVGEVTGQEKSGGWGWDGGWGRVQGGRDMGLEGLGCWG